jgi:xanthine dehydrogenase accessory factor
MKELLEIIRARQTHPQVPFALATVVQVEGSSYRKPGARMLSGMNGRVAGSVSGGCLEKDVISRGLRVVLNGRPELAVYDTTDQDDLAFGTSLGCEGRIEILVEPLLPGSAWPLRHLVEQVVDRRSALALGTYYFEEADGLRMGHYAWDAARVEKALSAPPEIERDLHSVLSTKKNLTRKYAFSPDPVTVFIERLAPPRPLVIFGAGHDVPPLVRLARELGFHVTVVDRRSEFADPKAFPEADRVICARPGHEKGAVRLDENTAAVVMNHHYDTDAAWLDRLLVSPVAYLGMLGPRRRTGRILDELRQGGKVFSEPQLARVHAPAGLDIGSENPEQIALSILAEIQAVLSGRDAGSLKDRRSPIHSESPAPVCAAPSLEPSPLPCHAPAYSS